MNIPVTNHNLIEPRKWDATKQTNETERKTTKDDIRYLAVNKLITASNNKNNRKNIYN